MIEMQSKVAGEFRLTVRKRDTDEVVREVSFKNLILNTGLNRIMSGSNASLGYCYLGTGTSAPAVTDTSLTGAVQTTSLQASSADSYTAGPPAYFTASRTFRFAVGVAAGTWTEIAIGFGTPASGNLWSRALILDAGGSPTSITILSDEYLDADYFLRVYPPTGDTTGTLTIPSGSAAGTYTVTVRPASNATASYWGAATVLSGMYFGAAPGPAVSLSSCSGSMVAANAAPASCSPTGVSVSSATYTTGTFYRNQTVTFGITNLPTGGVMNTAMVAGWGTWAPFQFGFSPGVPKTNANTISITVRHSIARYP